MCCRNSFEEEEDLYISACRTIKRRTQEKPFHMTNNMATGGILIYLCTLLLPVYVTVYLSNEYFLCFDIFSVTDAMY